MASGSMPSTKPRAFAIVGAELVARQRSAQSGNRLTGRVANDGANRKDVVEIFLIRDRVAKSANIRHFGQQRPKLRLGVIREPAKRLGTDNAHHLVVGKLCQQSLPERGRVKPSARARRAGDGDRPMALQRSEVNNGAVPQHAEIGIDPVALRHDAQFGKADRLEIGVREIGPPDLKGAVSDPVLQSVRAMLDII